MRRLLRDGGASIKSTMSIQSTLMLEQSDRKRRESTPGGQGSNGGSGSSNGLRFELLGQIVTNKLFYHGRCDFLHVFNVFGTGWHVQDGEERHGLGQVGVVPQGIAHVILSGDENISWSDYYCLKSKITTKKVKKWTWKSSCRHRGNKKTALSAVLSSRLSQNQHDATDGGVSFYPIRSRVERSSHSSQRGGLCYSRGGPGGGTKTIVSPTMLLSRQYNPRKLQRDESHCVCGINIPIIPDGGPLNMCLWDNKGRWSDFIFRISSAVFKMWFDHITSETLRFHKCYI